MSNPSFKDDRLPARFWRRVTESASGCWLWTGRLGTKGYGQIDTDPGVTSYAHRFAYVALVGNTREVLDHICHVRRCVNPAHLQSVTTKQNNENRLGANRNSRSGVRGVRRRRNFWEARVRHNGVLYEQRFKTLDEASAAVVRMRNALFTNNLADREMEDAS